MDYTIFRKNVKALIESRGKPLYVLAEEIGTTQPTLSRYLNGSRNPDLPYAVMLARYFDVSLDWLLGLDEDNDVPYSEELREVAELYSLATPDDRNVIHAVLNKYRRRN